MRQVDRQRCRCKAPETRVEVLECLHVSGSLKMPRSERSAHVRRACGGFVRWGDLANLALSMFAPLSKSKPTEGDPAP